MDLEAFIKDVLTPALDYPEKLIVETKRDGKKLEIILYAPQIDRGRIVGRNGRMISSLRTLCKAAGEKQGLTVSLELDDGDAGAED
jgi:predicted RNA-binding protein YlqC (UPF0109 family)